ncbi:hypothetical protein WJX72_002475 [[Myrmecia] bisecta]|uniref:Gfo/Idh/MocA-like oxidoreductase N-terminal domain-containing protein n=1 Tax=[Myrmecia] bisecta TaxID=41462 RepID=A0AAW1Q3J9_9CHLO
MASKMASHAPVRIGILGAANIAKKNARGILKAEGGIEVGAVGSRTLEKAQAFIESTGTGATAKAYGSYQAVLDDSNIDAVYLPLPTSMHVEWVRKAAAAGKHILLEKPLAQTTEELREIVDACSRAGVQLMDGTMWMHNPRAAKMRQVLDDPNAMGLLKNILSGFYFMASEEFSANDIRTKKDLDSLGCLGDLGWYNVRFILWAYNYDRPASVTAHPAPAYNQNEVLIHVGATLIWKDGRRACFECGFDRAFTQLVEVGGTRGLLQLDDFVIPHSEDKASFMTSHGTGLADLDTRVVGQQQDVTVVLPRPQETLMWEAFADCVRTVKAGGKPNQHWVDIAAQTQEVLCAIADSVATSGKTITL